jgi:hypothetical protein
MQSDAECRKACRGGQELHRELLLPHVVVGLDDDGDAARAAVRIPVVLQGQLQQKNAAVVGAGGGRLPAPGDDDLVRSAGAMRARQLDGAIVRPSGRYS